MSLVSRFSTVALSLVFIAPLLVACGSPEQKAQSYYEQGLQEIANHEDLNARVTLLKSIKYKSDKVETWRALAGIDERTKSNQGLFGDLRRIVELDPNDDDARIKLARMMVGAGATEPARKLIETVDDSDKPNAAFHAVKALILARSNEISAAQKEAERALAIDPTNLEATLLLAAKKLADNDAQAALKLLDALPADKANEASVQLSKVQAYARANQPAKAEEILRKLVAENPKEPRYRNDLIQFLIATKRFDEAERELRAVADAEPANAKAAVELVRFLASTRGAAAARSELTARIAKGGDVFDLQLALTDLDAAEGHATEAEMQLKKLLEANNSPERKTTVQLKLAALYVSRSDFASAEPIIADVLKQDRRNGTALRLRAAIRIEQGQFNSAVADLREALNDQPKSIDLLMLLATAYERSGKNELADRQYADALKASGQTPAVVLRYVSFLQRRGDLSHAEDVTIDALGRNANNPQLLATLAQLRLSRENWTGALAVADTVAKVGGNESAADQIRAAAFAGQKRFDQSVAALEAAHAAAPTALQPVVNLVSTYIRLGKPDKADALLQDLLKKYPDSAEVLVLLGQTRMAQNKPSEAEQSFKAAIDKQPKDANGYTALSDFYSRQKNYAAAIHTMEAGLQQLPGNLNFRFNRAGLLILAGDTNGAIAEYEAILKDQPGSLLAINNLVSLALDDPSNKELTDRAMSLAERLKGSQVPQFQDTYGWSEFRRGDIKGAIATLEAARTKLNNLAAVRYHLGMSYLAAGDKDKANEEFKAAAGIEPDGTALKKNILDALKQTG